jgi:hypothetical protein
MNYFMNKSCFSYTIIIPCYRNYIRLINKKVEILTTNIGMLQNVVITGIDKYRVYYTEELEFDNQKKFVRIKSENSSI